MPYPAKLLNPDESVALDLNPHWWYFAESVSSFAVSGILWLFVFGQDDRKSYLTYPIGVIALATLVWVIVRYLKWRTTYFVITSDRLIYRNGVIGKSGIEIPLERVNNVNFKQGIFERIIGAGDLLIESGGEDGQQRFSDVSHPDRVQNLIHTQMEENQKRSFRVNVTGGNDVATQLEKLEGLRDRGSISAEEFESQKRRLLES
ncbi:MAG: PH domain-containing protein [Actinomycetota bacterium]|nr:PH domain-containing protein [Actinomycetota bacterium]MDA3019437.1 PH domain-containing protein [Actinomycetota bacterium]